MPRVTTATVGVVVAFVVIRGTHGSKAWDKAAFAVVVALVALLVIHFVVRPPTRAASIVTSVCATGGLLAGIALTERPELHLWGGFGLSVALTTLCIAVYLWRALDRVEASPRLRTAITTAVAVLAVSDLASLLRTLSHFVHIADNVYVVNEMLAPAAGRVPGATSVPQYVGLYGWLLVPFRHVMSARSLAELATIFLSCLAVLSVLLAVAIAARTTSSRSLWIAAGVVIPLTCVTVAHGTNPYSSIASYMPELPIRLFPTVLLSFLGLETLSRLRAGSEPNWRLPALGTLAGLIVWNSQDFGLAATVAYFIVLVVALPPAQLRKSMLLSAGGLVGGVALYPVLTGLAGAPVNARYFALFSRTFSGGFLQVLIQVPGPVLVVLPIIASSAAIGWYLLWRERHRNPSERASDSPTRDRAVLTLALVGTWATGGFAYYLNRSYASEFLQILLMPCGICIVSLLSLARDARSNLPTRRSFRVSLSFVPIALLAALGLASILQSPNPRTVANDLTGTPYRFTTKLIPTSTLDAARAFTKARGGSLGYFGNNGNYVHLETGLPNVLLVDDPVQLTYSPALRRAGCRYLAEHATTWVVTSPTDDDTTGPDICGSYRAVRARGLPPRTLFVQKR